nr:uncharacterized protein LOC117976337 isoform X3 [Pan paniscus]
MAAPLLHTRLPGDAAASSSAVKTLGASRTGISNMRALENDFFNSPPRKTVRFGGTVTEVLLKYKKGETNDFELLKNQLLDPDIKNLKIGSSENIRHRMSLPSTLQQNFRTLNFGFIISQEGSFSLEEDGILDVNSFSQDHRSRLLVFMNFFFFETETFFFFFFFFDMESRSSRSSWSGIARSWITAPFTSQIQAILVPQPPEPLRLQAHAIMPDFPGPDSQSCPQCPAASRAPSVTKMQRSGRHCAAPEGGSTVPPLSPSDGAATCVPANHAAPVAAVAAAAAAAAAAWTWPRVRRGCCHGHDCCYTRAEEAGCSPKTERYSWQCINQSILCGQKQLGL